jgi:Protein of unknown function (DUF3565)
LDRAIIALHQDEQGNWVADLECGHTQHVRHDPPWVERPWVTTPDGRQNRMGAMLNCRQCDVERRGSVRDQGTPPSTTLGVAESACECASDV